MKLKREFIDDILDPDFNFDEVFYSNTSEDIESTCLKCGFTEKMGLIISRLNPIKIFFALIILSAFLWKSVSIERAKLTLVQQPTIEPKNVGSLQPTVQYPTAFS